MNRKTFFKKLGIGAAAVITTPKILAELKPEPQVIGIPEMIKMREKLVEDIAGILLIDQSDKTDYIEFAQKWREKNGKIIYSDPMSKYEYVMGCASVPGYYKY